MDRSRRALLTALGAALSASVAGCPGTTNEASTADPTAEPPQSAGTPNETTASANSVTRTDTAPPGPVVLEPGESYTTAAGWSLTVDDVTVRNAVVGHGTTHLDPEWAEDGQFVGADFAVDGDGAPDPANLNVTCRLDTGDAVGWTYVHVDGQRDDSTQRIGFEVPSSPAPEAGAVVWTPDDGPEVRWTLPDDALAEIARPPAFDLRSFTVADAPGDEVEATLTVANVGEGDGTFLAEVGDAAMSDQGEVAVEVPAGETRTVTRRVWAETRNDGPTTVVLRWRDTRIERTVGPSETATATARTRPGTATPTDTDG